MSTADLLSIFTSLSFDSAHDTTRDDSFGSARVMSPDVLGFDRPTRVITSQTVMYSKGVQRRISA